MNELQLFNYEGKEVRTITKDGEPWFVAKDVCDVLDYANANMATARLDSDEVSQAEVIDSMGRRQNTNIISESGLYNLIIRSDKPEAKQFKRWITHEVIPSIRKTGTYSVKPMTQSELILASAQQLVEMERKINNVSERLDKTLDVFTTPSQDNWKEDMNHKINGIIEANGLVYQAFKGELYKQLESSACCDLNARQSNLINRLKQNGASYAACKAVTKLDVIDRDARLRLIFEGIVRKWQAKYARVGVVAAVYGGGLQ